MEGDFKENGDGGKKVDPLFIDALSRGEAKRAENGALREAGGV